MRADARPGGPGNHCTLEASAGGEASRSITTTDPATLGKGHKKVIFASSLGTVFEWYDFYLYGSLAAIIAKQFFSGVNETIGLNFALLAFAAGLFARPFDAIRKLRSWRSTSAPPASPRESPPRTAGTSGSPAAAARSRRAA